MFHSLFITNINATNLQFVITSNTNPKCSTVQGANVFSRKHSRQLCWLLCRGVTRWTRGCSAEAASAAAAECTIVIIVKGCVSCRYCRKQQQQQPARRQRWRVNIYGHRALSSQQFPLGLIVCCLTAYRHSSLLYNIARGTFSMAH